VRKLLLAVALVGVALLFWTVPAPAQAPDQQGWWWLAGATGIAPPGVPADGLYVASNPSGTQGVSALRFSLAGGGSAGTLRLDLAGAPSGTPVIGLCQLNVDWKAVQGGGLSDAPACAEGGPTIAGQATADGQSYTFAVGSLMANGLLNVEVIPGKDASGNNPTFSVAFKKPASDALTAPGGTHEPSGAGETEPAPAPAPSFTAQPSYNAPPAAFEPAPPDAPITGERGSPSSSGGSSGGSGLASPVAPIRHDSGSSSGWRIAGFAILALTAIAYHRLSMTPDRAPRSLVTFGQLPGEEQP